VKHDNRSIKKHLKTAFDPPAPMKKDAFLASLNYPRTTYFGFVAAQVRYIRKRIWCASFLLVGLVLAGLAYLGHGNFIWIVSAFLPLVALAGIMEVAKSLSYNMAELEMSCKYSLSDIVLARLGIIGAVNAVAFIVITAALLRGSGMGLIPLIVQLFTPYLLTTTLSLFSLNRFRMRGTLYVCAGVSCLASALSAGIHINETVLMGLFALLLLGTAREIIKLIRTEDGIWNLSLTA